MRMNKKDEIQLAPKLRFPEFKKSGKWEEKKLGEIGDVIRGASPRPKGDSRYYGGNIPRLMVADVTRDGKYVTPKIDFLTVEGAKLSRPCKSGTLTVVCSGTVGIPSILAVDACIHDGFLALINLKKIISLDYLFYQIKKLQLKFENSATHGGVFTNLTTEILNNFLISFPSLPEQQKIADCLSSLDECISAETRKLESLRLHKKGLMQNLFPAEGESVPKLRFPEFKKSGKWEEKKLGDVAYYENGKAHEQDILEHGKYKVVNSKFISSEGSVIKYTDTAFCIANKNDILMVLSDVPNGKAIAKCFIVGEDDLYTVNQRVCKITPKEIDKIILFYLLNRNQYFLRFDDGVKQTNLRNEDVLSCPLKLPREIMEQQKIADCLSSLDECISSQSQKIESLKLHKKGLMQNLFPSMEDGN
jgi:type I restriction enzyme, S subunit